MIQRKGASIPVKSKSSFLRVGQAAACMGLSRWAFFDAARDGRIRLIRNRRGFCYVRREDLFKAPILTLGRAARLINRHYEVLRRAAVAGRLRAVRLPYRSSDGKLRIGYRHVSLHEARRFSNATRRLEVSLFGRNGK